MCLGFLLILKALPPGIYFQFIDKLTRKTIMIFFHVFVFLEDTLLWEKMVNMVKDCSEMTR